MSNITPTLVTINIIATDIVVISITVSINAKVLPTNIALAINPQLYTVALGNSPLMHRSFSIVMKTSS